MNRDGESKDLPGRKASNGKWPCLDEFIDDHWLGQGKIFLKAHNEIIF